MTAETVSMLYKEFSVMITIIIRFCIMALTLISFSIYGDNTIKSKNNKNITKDKKIATKIEQYSTDSELKYNPPTKYSINIKNAKWEEEKNYKLEDNSSERKIASDKKKRDPSSTITPPAKLQNWKWQEARHEFLKD